ncbi:MAG TPA: ABC transporter permease [Gemmataceae bacterium]|nr:ABC transporter permease [Gemmataceae bacterium]
MQLISIIVTLGVLALLVVPMLGWDKGRRSLLLALRSLWLHKLRAFLSVLGIIIGTAAVIALMAFGEGSMHDALEDIKRQGATNIIVRSVKPPDDSASQQSVAFFAAYGITPRDYEFFESIPSVTRLVPMRIFPQDIRYLSRIHNGRVVATTPQYAEIHKLEMAAGRFLTDDDDFWIRNVAVLGSNVAERLFPFEDPIGQTIRLQNYYYVVVGVLKERTPLSMAGGQAVEDFNNDVYIPLTTCRGRYGLRIYIRQSGTRMGEMVYLHQVTLTVSDIDKVRPTGKLIEEVLSRHPKPDTLVTVPLDRLEEAERAKNRYKMLLVLIASISLVVGGIGIMNIMLATVTERTREIGIRRALGAKRRDITLQFLVESVVQTAVGGLFGVLLGLGIAYLVPLLARWVWEMHLPARIHVPSIFLSLVVAIGVGVIFGLYPARRAALLDPIEALRHE